MSDGKELRQSPSNLIGPLTPELKDQSSDRPKRCSDVIGPATSRKKTIPEIFKNVEADKSGKKPPPKPASPPAKSAWPMPSEEDMKGVAKVPITTAPNKPDSRAVLPALPVVTKKKKQVAGIRLAMRSPPIMALLIFLTGQFVLMLVVGSVKLYTISK